MDGKKGIITQSTRYEIVKPMDCSWSEFTNLIRDLRNQTSQLMNRTIQLCWEYDGFSSEYRRVNGSYPKMSDVLEYTSIQNYCYKQLKDTYYKFYSGNLSQSVKRAADNWKSNRKGILNGSVSIPSYKGSLPIDVVKDACTITKDEDGKYYANLSIISSTYKRELNRTSCSYLVEIKVNGSSMASIVDRIISGEYKQGACQVVEKKNKKGKKKWFLLVPYSFIPLNAKLDPSNIMGIDLGIVNAVYFSFSNSKLNGVIKGGEVEQFRKQIEKRRISISKQVKYSGEGRKGHGVSTALSPKDSLSNKIANFRNTTNERYAKYLVSQAVKLNCGTIQLEDLSNISQDYDYKRVKYLRYWTYNDLQTKIEHCASKVGITVIKVNPAFTSQRCYNCGYVNKNNRLDQANFICVFCGNKMNADHNASLNLTISGIDEIIKNTLRKQSTDDIIDVYDSEQKAANGV